MGQPIIDEVQKKIFWSVGNVGAFEARMTMLNCETVLFRLIFFIRGCCRVVF